MMMMTLMIHQIGLGITDPLHHPISTNMLPLHYDHERGEEAERLQYRTLQMWGIFIDYYLINFLWKR
jgi:hypothetical protein